MSAAALALGVQQAGAVYSGISDYDGSRDNGRVSVRVTNNITANTTWASNKVYLVDRLICVKSGATLTIQPGCVIRGFPVSSVPQQPGSVLVSRGGKINAVGTAQRPIIFTDMYDDNWDTNYGTSVTIPAGVHTAGPLTVDYGKLNNHLTGMWGGLLLCGKSYIAWDALDGSKIYSPDPRVETAVEAIVAAGSDTSYGGCNDLDNSGTLNYVASRYSGFVLGPSKEINGMTFCGVGRNTSVDHLDVYQAKDDNVEFFGGCLNMKHLVAWNGCDDGLDTDTGWRGKVQFVFIAQGVCTNSDLAHSQLPDTSDKGLEWDGAGDSTGFNDDPQSCGTLLNATIVGMGSNSLDNANTAFTLRDNAGGRLANNIFMDFGGGCSLIEGVANPTSNNWPYGVNCSAAKLTQLYTQDRYFLSGTNKQGTVLSAPANGANYIGYRDAMAFYINGVLTNTMFVDFKRNLFWNMGTPHSIGFVTNGPSSGTRYNTGIDYWGNDNGRFAQHAVLGASPEDAGYDIVAPGNFGGNTVSADLPVMSFERDDVINMQPTFRNVPHNYSCVKKIDPRVNTNLNLMTSGVLPPADGFYTPVMFQGAMGKKNWAGPWSTAWRLGGFETNGVPTGDETGIAVKVTKTGSGTSGKVNISVNPDTYAGIDADWWIVAVRNSDGVCRWFNLASWQSTHGGIWYAYQGSLFTLAPYAIPMNTLPTGTWTVYFGVDLNKDGLLTWDSLVVGSIAYTR